MSSKGKKNGYCASAQLSHQGELVAQAELEELQFIQCQEEEERKEREKEREVARKRNLEVFRARQRVELARERCSNHESGSRSSVSSRRSLPNVPRMSAYSKVSEWNTAAKYTVISEVPLPGMVEEHQELDDSVQVPTTEAEVTRHLGTQVTFTDTPILAPGEASTPYMYHAAQGRPAFKNDVTATRGLGTNGDHVTPLSHHATPFQSRIDDGRFFSIMQALDQTLSSQQELSKSNRLPAVNLPTFDGDVTRFDAFCNSFTWNVENNTADSQQRLTHLYSQLEGLPKKLIEGCMSLDPSEGYARAWTLLRRDYARSIDKEEAFIKKLLSWKKIDPDDVDELREYGYFLDTVKCALGVNISRMELAETMGRVVNNLPEHLIDKWAAKSCKLQPSFSMLVDFVANAANVAKARKDIKAFDLRRAEIKSRTFTTLSESKSKKIPIHSTQPLTIVKGCVSCGKEGHSLLSCFAFPKKGVQDRWKVVKSNRLCFRCLQPGHRYRKCLENCKCALCGTVNHHSLLHEDFSRKPSSPITLKSVPVSEETGGGDLSRATSSVEKSTLTMSKISSHIPDGSIMMKVIPVTVNNSIKTYAFLDCGAATSLASRNLIEKLDINGSHVSQVMRTECGDFRCEELVSLRIGDIENHESLVIDEVYVTGKLTVTTDHMMPVNWAKRWSHLEDIELPRLNDNYHNVDLIIGLNCSLCREILDQRTARECDPTAHLTKFGWVVFGPTGLGAKKSPIPVNHISPAESSDYVKELLQEHFNHDFWESERNSRVENSVEDKEFLEKVGSSIHQVMGKYCIKLPLRDHCPIANNREAAVQRLETLKKKFSQDENYRHAYIQAMEKNIQKGYAEHTPCDQLGRNDGKVRYLPHFSVQHPSKLKIRVVFDPKVKFQGTSLNEYLLQGPDLTNNLAGTLLRFRNGRHAVTADLEDMYCQVQVPMEDRDLLRFLWWPGGDTTLEPVEYRMIVHPFGVKSSGSCVNYALRHTTEDHGHKYCYEASKAIKNNFYVDNLLKAHDDEELLKRIIVDIISLCKDGGWRLNQWTSSNRSLLSVVPETERDASVASLDLSKDELPVERTLGMHWSMEGDFFTFKINLKKKPHTRRGILSVVASVYDPLGLIAPILLPAKLLLQDMCREELKWDDDIGEAETLKWKAWCEQLPLLETMKVKRNYVPENFGTVETFQLHHFADASQTGYGIASYLRMENRQGVACSVLVFGRSRVAPLKRTTIPRLELTAAVVAARMDCKLREELDVKLEDSVFWTDSTAVLKYLLNRRARYHTFVANRVNLLRELTSTEAWKYVDTCNNPADLASRGMGVEALMESALWFSGPGFLSLPAETWPTMPSDVKCSSFLNDPEVRTTQIICDAMTAPESFVDDVVKRFSSWLKFIRCIAWMRHLYLGAKNALERMDILSAEEVEHAKFLVFMMVQQDAFPKEIKAVHDAKGVVSPSSKLARLKPFILKGLLCVGGRLRESNLGVHARNPVILPKNAAAVRLLVRWTHQKLGHCGQNYLVADLRQHYWILQVNSLARSVIRKCVRCRAIAARPITQEMAELPPDRITPGEPPFSRTATDCFGPFMVKIGRSQVKRYGVLFTCLVSRAIHIEMADSMETDSFINALRRFLARRGPVQLMRADNGTNIVGADNVLRKELEKLNHVAINDVMSAKGITWCYNPPYSSHWGGAWERQIRSIRRVLNGICDQQTLTDEALTTLFCEVEAIVNGRPLIRVTDDPECTEVLSPSMLLNLKGSPTPIALTAETDQYSRVRWKHVQYLADLFWKRWIREYLPLLQQRQRWTTLRRNLQVGDIVLALDEKLPRGTWPLGRVLEVIHGSDGNVRSARLKTGSGTYLRPITKMCLLLECDKV